MSLTGPPKPTFLYPRFKYGTPAVTLDIPEPASRIPTITPFTGLRGSNTVSTGKTEYLYGRGEEQVGLVLRCEQDILAALRWFIQDSAAPGNQFQAWVDRYTGSCWMFENNLKDQNGLALTLNGTAAYADVTNGRGLTLTGSMYLTIATAQASAVTATGFDDPFLKDEGIIVIDWKAGHAATDNSIDRYFIDTTPASNCRISLFKSTDTKLYFQIIDGTPLAKQVRGTVAWAIGDRVQIVASWTTAGAMTLWYAVNSGAFVQLTESAMSGTGIMATMPSALFVGAGFGTANLTLGTYDSVAFFKRAFANPQASFANFRPVERNYFAYGELVTASFQPGRVVLGRTIWDWPISVRNGQP
jgi:hypothetical protein